MVLLTSRCVDRKNRKKNKWGPGWASQGSRSNNSPNPPFHEGLWFSQLRWCLPEPLPRSSSFEKSLRFTSDLVALFKSMLPLRPVAFFLHMHLSAPSRYHTATAHTVLTALIRRVQLPQLMLSDLPDQRVEGIFHSLSRFG